MLNRLVFVCTRSFLKTISHARTITRNQIEVDVNKQSADTNNLFNHLSIFTEKNDLN